MTMSRPSLLVAQGSPSMWQGRCWRNGISILKLRQLLQQNRHHAATGPRLESYYSKECSYTTAVHTPTHLGVSQCTHLFLTIGSNRTVISIEAVLSELVLIMIDFLSTSCKVINVIFNATETIVAFPNWLLVPGNKCFTYRTK